jgi:predicted GNAT family N-acyltransferase
MSTTSIAFQSPVGDKLRSYDRSLLAYKQSFSIPPTFYDSMTVRETVFVDEMKAVPLTHHIDTDDARSFHWVLYISPDSATSRDGKPRPVGTLRLVPFPHYPHPEPGARFEAPSVDTPLQDSETFFTASSPEYAIDRATSLHDGKEVYLKLGRLCVVKEFRRRRLADQLVQTALNWAKDNPDFAHEEMPAWKGLVCVHAQEKAVSMWQRNGFVIDEGMGTWFEAGIKHYGMFTRVDLKDR